MQIAMLHAVTSGNEDVWPYRHSAALPFRRAVYRASRRQLISAYRPSLFDEMVKDGRMPRPKRINARTIWDRKRLDVAFDAIPDGDPAPANPWDDDDDE